MFLGWRRSWWTGIVRTLACPALPRKRAVAPKSRNLGHTRGSVTSHGTPFPMCHCRWRCASRSRAARGAPPPPPNSSTPMSVTTRCGGSSVRSPWPHCDATSTPPVKCRAEPLKSRIAKRYFDCQGRVQHPCVTIYPVYAPGTPWIGGCAEVTAALAIADR